MTPINYSNAVLKIPLPGFNLFPIKQSLQSGELNIVGGPYENRVSGMCEEE